MKNINYHKSPLDKMRAHERFCCNNVRRCPYSNLDTMWHRCPMRDLCFNAWLHSNRDGVQEGGAE